MEHIQLKELPAQVQEQLLKEAKMEQAADTLIEWLNRCNNQDGYLISILKQKVNIMLAKINQVKLETLESI